MDLHLVTYFVAVVDHGGITKAAQSLYISQPSLSQAIRTLERRLGVTLFDRSGRRLELTDAGRKFDVAARRILLDVDRVKTKVEAVRELRAGRVDIVTYAAFSIDPLVEMIAAFRQRFPRLSAHVIAADGPTGVLTALRHGDAEIGVIDTAADHAAFTAIPLGEQDLVLAGTDVVAAGWSDPMPRAAVREIPLVVDVGNPNSASFLDEVLDDDAANVVIDCAHPPATWELVSGGVGATILPRTVAEQQLPNAHLRGLDPPLRRPYGLVLRSTHPSPAAMAFIAVARGLHEIDSDANEFGEW
ncbi:LysR family transcriptional regulator [Gordonia sp. CPCC 205515]|uniref:LysR family transcriptional regulator n=1 Tax=Gordonia sp. CPCC 205515 TaxID=3140791 RepID=UPI003AF35215